MLKNAKLKSISLFYDKIKVADFWCKHADISRTQGVCTQFTYHLGFFRQSIAVSIFIIAGYA